MINIFEVKETNNMVEHENLDVRTITIGISLLSCIDSDLKKLNENIYNRITSVAKILQKLQGRSKLNTVSQLSTNVFPLLRLH